LYLWEVKKIGRFKSSAGSQARGGSQGCDVGTATRAFWTDLFAVVYQDKLAQTFGFLEVLTPFPSIRYVGSESGVVSTITLTRLGKVGWRFVRL
jgi:hypothetical protein